VAEREHGTRALQLTGGRGRGEAGAGLSIAQPRSSRPIRPPGPITKPTAVIATDRGGERWEVGTEENRGSHLGRGRANNRGTTRARTHEHACAPTRERDDGRERGT
jgi:hypothetical protein